MAAGSPAARTRLLVLISGTGRNLQAMIDARSAGTLDVDMVGVISNRPGVTGLRRAEHAGIPTQVVDHRDYASREAFDHALLTRVTEAAPDIVALAGFMRILTPVFITPLQGRLLNIHPSLLPKYRGLNTHARALAAGDRWHGASVHLVTEELDDGPVVLQGRTAITHDDTPESLAERVMRDVEVHIYPQVLRWIASGRLRMIDGRAEFDGSLLDTPLDWHDIANAEARPT